MTLNEYQEKAMTTCMPSCDNFAYMFLNLVGEVGEFASKVAKAIRKDKAYIGGQTEVDEPNDLTIIGDTPEYSAFCDELRKEAGDCLWQLSGVCKVMGWSLEEVAEENLKKLASRKERGVIDGNGDNR